MFVQLGFIGALEDSSVVMHRHLRADLVMLHSTTEAIIMAAPFSRRRLYQLLNFPSVDRVTPIYLDLGWLRNSENGRSRTIVIYGINPIDRPFDLPDIDRQLEVIRRTDTVLFDRQSRPEYGPIAAKYDRGEDVFIELNAERIRVGGVGNFFGTSFGVTGNLITSDTNISRMFPIEQGNLENLAFGAIQLQPGYDANVVAAQLNRTLPADVTVVTKAEFIDREQSYWRRTTAVGFIFQMGAAVGFAIGMYIVYQVLFTDIANHIPDYAILKAKGYPAPYFWNLVIQESVILSISSYIPSYVLALLFYYLIQQGTQLPMTMTYGRSVLVFSLTLAMCLLSGFLVMRKLRDSDPADLF